jgi:SAM-dependent methyltransferase
LNSTFFQNEEVAGAYERLLMPRIFEPWGRVLLDRAAIPEGGSVLDVATGPGTIAQMAAKRVGPRGHVDGVDISPQMIAEARGKTFPDDSAPIDYGVAPADALPFSAATFDVVTCQQGLQFFPDQAAALREMRRVLRPGGRVAVAMWVDSQAMALFASFHWAFQEVTGKHRPELAWLDAPGLRSALEGAGFSRVEVEEKSLVARFEQGLSEVLSCVDGTFLGPSVRAMTAEDRQRFQAKVAEKLQPHARGQAMEVPARSLVAVAIG